MSLLYLQVEWPHFLNQKRKYWDIGGNVLISVNASISSTCYRVYSEKAALKFHEYICELFNAKSADFNLEIDKIDLDFMPDFKIKKVIIHDNHLTLKKWNEFFQKFQEVTFVDITKDFNKIDYDESTPKSLMKIRNLIFRKPEDHSSSFLKNFQGEHGFFENAKLSSSDLNRFLKNWIRRKDKNRLKSLIFMESDCWYWGSYKFKKSAVFDGIPTQPCDLGRRKQYPYEAIIKEHLRLPEEFFNCQEGTEITRKFDGKIGTVIISKNMFAFFVWPTSGRIEQKTSV